MPFYWPNHTMEEQEFTGEVLQLAAAMEFGQITLDWESASSSGSGPTTAYKVYRSTPSGGETLYASIGNVLTYTDSVVPPGQYSYKVAAVNGVGLAGGNPMKRPPSAPTPQQSSG